MVQFLIGILVGGVVTFIYHSVIVAGKNKLINGLNTDLNNAKNTVKSDLTNAASKI